MTMRKYDPVGRCIYCGATRASAATVVNAHEATSSGHAWQAASDCQRTAFARWIKMKDGKR